MPRGYRCVILAAVGWLILVGPGFSQTPKPQTARNQSPATERIANAAEQLAATNQQEGPASYQRPCKGDGEDRDSDLCAQWKAADAAGSGAGAGWWQVYLGGLGLVLGSITMTAAIFAAIYARDAARETQRSAKAAEDALAHAKQVAKDELRPWVFVEKASLSRKNGKVYVECTIKNFGNMPARHCIITGQITIVEYPIPINKVYFCGPQKENFTIAPGGNMSIVDRTNRSIDDNQAYYFNVTVDYTSDEYPPEDNRLPYREGVTFIATSEDVRNNTIRHIMARDRSAPATT
jgi:hypothetical protein